MKVLFVTCVLATLLIPVIPACAGTITDSTNSFTVGIGPNGELFDYPSYIGFRRLADGFDPLAPGSPRDSWGVSANGVSAYADQADFGASNIVGTTAAYGANSATLSTTTSIGLKVDQSYSFITPNILAIKETVTNTSGSADPDVLFQRDIDWDVYPTEFNENTVGPPILGNVIDSTYYGFDNPDPLAPYFDSCALGCNFTADLGGGIKLDLGPLAAGGSTTFEYLYGLSNFGQSPDALVGQAAGLGAYYSLVTSDSLYHENSALIAVAAPIPEPGTLALLATGLVAVIVGRKRFTR